MPDLSCNYEIKMLLTTLVKSGTSEPMARSKVMPIQNFHDLFMKWPDNESLDIKSLRLKVITLLALTAMLRPSDIAPNARMTTPEGETKVVFGVDQVDFQDRFAKLTFFGIKNDTSRTGFEVNLPRGSVSKLDPVKAL